MFLSLFFTLLPTVISLFILGCAAIFIVWHQGRKNRKRWSPLTSKLLRSPGHKLVQELDELEFDISSSLFAIWLIPVLTYASHVSGSYFGHQPESVFRIVINLAATALMEAYFIQKLLRLIDKKSRIREGYEAESAAGSELNQLMLDGAQVFHDLQAEGFNIDHVVVSPKGVFCVETKSRVKYATINGKPNVKVEFDGISLKFPSHVETAPVEQARLNAKWLKDWLEKSVGEQINVRPTVVLPGWFITTTGRSDVLVINGKNCRPLFSKLVAHQSLTDGQIQRIAYQIEQRCRDVEPARYRKTERSLALSSV